MNIASALERLTNDVRDVSGLKIDFEVLGEHKDRLPTEVETTLFRIAQESLNNAVKHAQATNVKMSLRLAERRADLFIQDNGCGFDTMQAMVDEEGPCWGLLGMKERVELAGGTLLVQSTLRQGTTIGACLPIEKK
jgi:two-component system sensor histidine kinase DegS